MIAPSGDKFSFNRVWHIMKTTVRFDENLKTIPERQLFIGYFKKGNQQNYVSK
jgi:hypothetical protein